MARIALRLWGMRLGRPLFGTLFVVEALALFGCQRPLGIALLRTVCFAQALALLRRELPPLLHILTELLALFRRQLAKLLEPLAGHLFLCGAHPLPAL